MEELEQKIQQVLSDPVQLSQIMDMARALGVMPPDADSAPDEAAEEHVQTAPVSKPPPDLPVTALLRQAGKLDRRQEDLLNALKPFLKPARREKIDRAMQIARLSQLAGRALRARQQDDE